MTPAELDALAQQPRPTPSKRTLLGQWGTQRPSVRARRAEAVRLLALRSQTGACATELAGVKIDVAALVPTDGTAREQILAHLGRMLMTLQHSSVQFVDVDRDPQFDAWRKQR